MQNKIVNPKWILKDVVLSIHHEQISEHGGIRGIRSIDLLESAINRAKNKWLYDNKKISLGALGATYCWSIAINHPFFDGNKRTALATMLVFFRRNCVDTLLTDQEKFLLMMQITQNKITEQQVWEFLSKKIIK